MSRVQLGDEVRITFEDHSEGRRYQVFTVRGLVIELDRKSITVNALHYADDKNADDTNTWTMTILRRDITLLQKATYD